MRAHPVLSSQPTSPWAVHLGVGSSSARGLVISRFGDPQKRLQFLVVQRVMVVKDLRSAQMGTIIGGFLKTTVLLIVILPGLLALAVLPFKLVPETMAELARACTPTTKRCR